MQFDIDEDDNFGKSGRVVRKKKDTRRADRKHLTGNAARELFLECLQLLLRKQVLWLVRRKGFHPDLEAVVRDLWRLRVRGFPGIQRDRDRDARGGDVSGAVGKEEGGGKMGARGEGGLEMFSSQEGTQGGEGESGEGDGGEGAGWTRKRKSWAGEVWALPGAMDTLALVYLGCVLRQEPVRIGDVFRWARNGQMPFLGAVCIRCEGWLAALLLTLVGGRLRAEGVAGPVAGLGPSLASDEICQVSWRRAAPGNHGLDAGIQGKPRTRVSRGAGATFAISLHQGFSPPSCVVCPSSNIKPQNAN